MTKLANFLYNFKYTIALVVGGTVWFTVFRGWKVGLILFFAGSIAALLGAGIGSLISKFVDKEE